MFRSILFLFIFSSLHATSPAKVKALYSSLDPLSISQHLALYELYPESLEGQKALNDAWKLLAGSSHFSQTDFPAFNSFKGVIEGVINLVNKPSDQETVELSDSELAILDKLGQHLPNRKLKGHWANDESEVLLLPTEEVDLARGLFLSQIPPSEGRMRKIRSYEAMLDLMALQILSRLSKEAMPEAKIRAVNGFIFEDMGYRFPPHSLYAKDIDLYTFLPSVLDSRKGVCLGVSILYIALSQRLELPLEVITPPGHIYVRYRQGNKTVNIETTARGIHLDSQEYLGIETRSLEQRNIKEVIGLAHFNQASVYWQNGEYEKALTSYRKAYPYLPQDNLLKELMAYNYLFTGQKELGELLLREVKNYLPEHAVSKQTVAEDYLAGEVDIEGIKPLFLHVDETRESILKKRKALENIVEKHPRFRSGIFALAVTWLQLHRLGEALTLLERYHALDSQDPTAEYYLAEIYMERLDYNKAWEHLLRAEEITRSRNHAPKVLSELRKALSERFPE